MLNWIKDDKEAPLALLKSGVRGKYTLTIKGHIQMGSMSTTSTSQSKWVLNIMGVEPSGYDLELLTLDNVLLEYSNPSLKDIDALNNMFKQIYNDLRLKVGRDGKLIKVENLEQVKARWQQVRTQLVEIQGQFVSIAQVLQLNDNLFANDNLLFDTINATEFFEWFMFPYGKALPNRIEKVKKSRFQTAEVPWQFYFEKKKITDNVDCIAIRGTVVQKMDQNWVKKAYGHFPYIDTSMVKPSFHTEAEYYIDATTGLITEAIIKTEEMVHQGLLFSKMDFHIKSEDLATGSGNDAKNNQSQQKFSILD